MQGRNPSPLAPVPAGPLTPPGGPLLPPPGLPPEPAPVAPMPALDQTLLEQLTGPRPVAPAPQVDPLLLKIARALQGFGAGVQGQGPQFLAGLREERERPMREFKVATEQFESRRRRATEIAEEKRQGEQRDIQRRADIQSDREFKIWAQRAKITDEDARAQARQAWELQKLREQERIVDEKAAAQEAKQLKLKAADLASKYRLAGAKEFSNELAERDLGLRDKVSSGADRWLSSHVQLEQARLNKIAAGGGTGTGGVDKQTTRLVEEFNQARQNLIAAYARGDAKGQEQFRMRLDQLARQLTGKPGIEVGYGEGQWPYLKVNGVLQGAQGAAPAQQQAATPAPTAAVAAQGQQKDPLGIR